MNLIGYWTPADEDNKLVYILSFPSLDARDERWLRDDPEWQKVADGSRERAARSWTKWSR